MKNKYPYEKAAAVLKVVAHPVRLSIIAILRDNEKMKVNEIQAAVGIKQSITSQHLNALFNKDILGRDKEGNEVHYYIKKKEVLNILSCIGKCCRE